VVSAVAAGAVLARPADAGEQRTARKMSITVNKPGIVVSGTEVTIRCRARDQAGKAVKGAQVSFRWHLPNGSCTHTQVTNANGVAANSHVTDCDSAAVYKAKVVITARWDGQIRTVTRYFTIVGGT
jgi:hypothetical protein